MKKFVETFLELRSFVALWSTQTLSTLGSAMTNFALVIWAYQRTGSALSTALMTVCSYAPYVVMSIFAGAISDRWNKKATILICDTLAALCTLVVFALLRAGRLEIWHLYGLNALNGLMNTVQQPAAEVAVSLLTPEKHYQKAGGMRAFTYALVNLMSPVLATALLALGGIDFVILFDLSTFLLAFFSLTLFIRIPDTNGPDAHEPVLKAARRGLGYLRENPGILGLILFLAAINLVASMYNAALPAMVLPRADEQALGLVNALSGAAMVVGSLIVSVAPAPKRRVRVIFNAMLLSMSTENFFLAFGKSVPIWSVGAVLGWLAVPIMNANLDALLRTHIPIDMQGRVYSARNTLQFFTIPVGYLLGGLLVDDVFEPLMAGPVPGALTMLFGQGKGAGAAMLFSILGVAGVAVCLIFRRNRSILALNE